jgi:hypothetical protein
MQFEYLTHPDIASLVAPLFALQKEGKAVVQIILMSKIIKKKKSRVKSYE